MLGAWVLRAAVGYAGGGVLTCTFTWLSLVYEDKELSPKQGYSLGEVRVTSDT